MSEQQRQREHEIHSALQCSGLWHESAYINGRWCQNECTFPVNNPATGTQLGLVTALDKEQVDEAIEGAAHAFKTWRDMSAEARGDILNRWHTLILEHQDELARIMVLEQGKTLSEAQGEIAYGASFVHWFAEEGKRAYGETMPSHIPNAQLMTFREPIGVAALITPWNFPSAMITRKAAAAMAIGCTVIVKPAEETPFSALALAHLADMAGIPAGVFNVVTGEPKMIAEQLCHSTLVQALSFTGSTRVGRLLLSEAANGIKKCAMELGGNAPFIVLEQGDLNFAVQQAVAAKFQTSGQDCLAANRIFVPRAQYEGFLQRFSHLMAQLNVGDGLEANVDLGPLINRAAVEKAHQLVHDALDKGARLVAGYQPDDQSLFFMPTLLADITPEMRVYREENFCPVAGVIAYDSLDEVLTMSNDTEYGLAAYVYGDHLPSVWRCIHALNVGMVSVNSVKMTGHPIPFGGTKQSGLGREGSRHGFDDFSELKYCCLGNVYDTSP
ncbi:NAD-dependent succinate-semialdehyde dehydrogenase [Vibrio agarilyticus]|nr:NAD-dependent succinate-semialdehyde dehydrogenase [Vibrio agarilyticus]